MKPLKRPSTTLAGIQVRTINRNGQALQDLSYLWRTFYENQVQQQITHRLNDDIWVVYHDYVSDHREEYTAFIGCPVAGPSFIPAGLDALTVADGLFLPRAVQGHMPQALMAEWEHIWQNDAQLNRTYHQDYEIHPPAPAEDLACWIYLSVHA